LNKINSSKIVNITGMMPGVGSIIKVGLTLGGVNKVQKIENKDIIEITDKYLLILELRSLKNEVMLMKYNELNDLYKSKLIENNTKKGFFNLF
jgi:hypothetical protein